MKPANLLSIAAIASMAFFASCKKSNDSATTSEEVETTFELSGKQAVADNFNEDDNFVLLETTAERGLQGGNFTADPSQANIILSCATVTVTPQTGFPKTITVDFGAGCASNGVFRSGKMIIVLSDSLRIPGSTAVMTFNNYFVNSYKREGTNTWTNTSTGTTKSWQRKVENGKVTAPDGSFWIHNSIKNVIQTEGVQTRLDPLDDVFLITGGGSVSNSNGRTRNHTIIEALRKKTICENIDKGRIRIDGPNHTAVLDFGNGVCDRIATISIDGNPPRTILLH
ncbi:MAG: putative lipoprotein precursor [Ferruginibacter sp.]|nr:putative lipoprotein precursor [Ferruginibacter sp.]